MIIGVGIDIVEISRIAAAIKRKAFIDRVFTPAEQAYCENRGVQRAASYAARFAAKEAVLKALGTGLRGGTWQDVEITNNNLGRPLVQMTGYYQNLAGELGVQEIYLSVTHAREYAAAQVVLWGGKQNEASNSSPNAGD
ncbi:MAG TPA: 4-phosphopantetheinyl transferase [Sporomusaceae bacterium]|uniref:holo-ACP synthase n=2 Tax=Anaerospora sp. TaxID=1960278 RepID=UPI000ED52E24|nr:holo-ACP synthase [Anaerospora sp.]HAK73998.1 4-phosphopantetheinyl transferase [Sporomusaceae bacterium]